MAYDVKWVGVKEIKHKGGGRSEILWNILQSLKWF